MARNEAPHLEDRCLVLAAGHCLTSADCQPDYELIERTDPVTFIIRGVTTRAQFDFDVVSHYAGPDIFKLHVNRGPHSLAEDELPQ